MPIVVKTTYIIYTFHHWEDSIKVNFVRNINSKLISVSYIPILTTPIDPKYYFQMGKSYGWY